MSSACYRERRIVIFFFFLSDREDESKTVWRTRNVRNWLARLDGEDGEVDVEMILGSTLSSNTPRVVSRRHIITGFALDAKGLRGVDGFKSRVTYGKATPSPVEIGYGCSFVLILSMLFSLPPANQMLPAKRES